MQICYFYLPIMNLGTSVTIASVWHDIRGGRPPSRSSSKSQPNAWFQWIHGILWPLNQYNVVEAEDLAWITLAILREWSSRPLFTRGFDTAMIMECLMSHLKTHEFSPLNNAPSKWSTVDLDQPYSRESPSRPWVSERIWKIKCDISSRFFKRQWFTHIWWNT